MWMSAIGRGCKKGGGGWGVAPARDTFGALICSAAAMIPALTMCSNFRAKKIGILRVLCILFEKLPNFYLIKHKKALIKKATN